MAEEIGKTHAVSGSAEPPFEACACDEPYLFVSYSHKDAAVVYPEIERLHRLGFRVWYDEGIPPATEWPEEVARALDRSSFFVVFISLRAVESQNVRNEINFAISHSKPLVAVHLEEAHLPPGLELRMGHIQAIMKYRMSADRYHRQLDRTLPATLRAANPQPTSSSSGAVESVVAEVETYAELTVDSSPAAATTYLDGEPIGTTPIVAHRVELGLRKQKQVELGFERAGYVTKILTATLRRGTPLTLETVQLVPASEPVKMVAAPRVAAPVREPAAGEVRVNPADGAEMVWIPPGQFRMGDDDRDDNPRHMVELSGFRMYKDLVTVAQYKSFCSATYRRMPPEPEFPSSNCFNPKWCHEDHPIVNVTWDDAMAYASWARAELPSEAQWEKAARGMDARRYPWGDEFDASRLWCGTSEGGDSGGTHRVGRLGISPYGCTDMAGNTWQWCKDWYAEDYWRSDRGADPNGPGAGESRVLRGGSWNYLNPINFRTALRLNYAPTYWCCYFGFRCVCGAESRRA